jgi:hypothetical protein
MHIKFKISFWVLPLILAISTSIAFAKRPKYTEIEIPNGGSISGVVKLNGPVPPPVSVNLNNQKNSEFCIKNANPNEQGELIIHHVETSDGNLKDAVVFIQGIEKGKSWDKNTLEIEFKDCLAFPKVTVIRKTPRTVIRNLIAIENYDAGILHNPKGFSIGEKTRKIFFKKWLLNKGARVDVTKSLQFVKKERDSHFYIECEQHPWMSVSSKIVWNPYHDVSKEDGAFKIDQIPPGQYKVVVWHPYVGEKTMTVDISSGSNTKLDLTLP